MSVSGGRAVTCGGWGGGRGESGYSTDGFDGFPGELGESGHGLGGTVSYASPLGGQQGDDGVS